MRFIPALAITILIHLFLCSPARAEEPSIFDTNWTAPERPPASVTPTPPPEPTLPGPGTPTPPSSQTPTPPRETPAIVKAAIPDLPAQDKNLALIKQIFEKEYATKNSAARKQLAARLLQEAGKIKKNYEARFVLLREARDIAADAGDVRRSRDALARLESYYALDLLPASVALVQKLNAQRETDDSALACWSMELLDQLIRREEYSIASGLAPIAESRASRTKYPVLQSQASRLSTILAEQTRLQTHFDTLKTAPGDPAANLSVGRFYCFLVGNWDKGLSPLAKSSDPVLKTAAASDLANPTDASAQFALAGVWWEAAKTNPSAEKKLKQRACDWYRKSLPRLADLDKVLAEKRMKEFAVGEESTSPTDTLARVIDLTGLVDPKRDSAGGDWRLVDGVLEAHGSGRIRIPYEPPAEYDFCIAYTRTHGVGDVAQICHANRRDFAWTVGGAYRYAGFSLVAGEGIGSKVKNPTIVDLQGQIAVGRKYISVVQVRRNGVQAWLDGKAISHLKTDYSNLSLYEKWSLMQTGILGLNTTNSSAVFHKIEIIEITGNGKALFSGPNSPVSEADNDGKIAGGDNRKLPPGADVNAFNSDGKTLLILAAEKGDVAAVEALLAQGADIELKDGVDSNNKPGIGRAPLHWAARYGHLDVVKLLLAKGANVNAKTTRGLTPLELAKMFKQKQVAEYLASKGGK